MSAPARFSFRRPPEPLAQCAASVGDRVLRLQDAPAVILQAMRQLDRLALRTCNASCSTTMRGNYRGLCLGHADTAHLALDGSRFELDLASWGVALAVLAPVADIPPRSVLFFDSAGELLQCINVRQEGLVFEELVCALLHPEQHSLSFPDVSLQRHVDVFPPDLYALERDWARACDEESFEQMLRSHGLSRLSAFERVSNSHALRIHPESLPGLFTLAAGHRQSLSLGLCSAGVRHCLEGVPSTPTWQGSSLVSELGAVTFSCDMSSIGSCWRVRRREQDQVVTSVEVFDRARRPVLCLRPTATASWQALLAQALLPVGAGILPQYEQSIVPAVQEN